MTQRLIQEGNREEEPSSAQVVTHQVIVKTNCSGSSGVGEMPLAYKEMHVEEGRTGTESVPRMNSICLDGDVGNIPGR